MSIEAGFKTNAIGLYSVIERRIVDAGVKLKKLRREIRRAALERRNVPACRHIGHRFSCDGWKSTTIP